MKTKSFIIIILMLISVFSFAQNTKDAQDLKKKKLIVALTGYPKKADANEKLRIDSLNASLKFAMEKYWNFNEVVNYLPLQEAKDFVKKNEGYCYIGVNVGVSKSLTKGTGQYKYRYVSYSEKLSIFTPKAIGNVYLPRYENEMSRVSVAYAVIQFNKILELLYDEKFTNIIGSLGYVKENGPKIINKTLLIPREYISPELTEADIKLAYPYDIDICDLRKIENAILSKDSKYAVLFWVPIPLNGKYINRLYISNAEDGDIYGVADGSKVSIDFGFFSVGGSSKKYLMNKKELQQIGKLVV